MIGFDEACAIVAEQGRPLGRESVKLDEAHGRVLAAPVLAQVDSPPADVSAMDGYAVREADLPTARIIGKSFPGAGYSGAVEPGECVRIFTGAPVPAGADRVVVQEIVRTDGDTMIVDGNVAPGRHIRRQGADFRAGDTLLLAGRRLDARALVAAAGADLGALEVWRQPRVTIFGTGDELTEPGTAREQPGTIPDSVSLGIGGLVAEWGGEAVGRQRLPDDRQVMQRAVGEALALSDVVVLTGGASVGEKDYAKEVLSALGLELIFSKVAIKPGKPVWFGRIGATHVMGLPGNPTSALVTGRLLLAPLLAGLSGTDPVRALRWTGAPLAAAVEACGDRETFLRGRWDGDRVHAFSNQDSGAQRTLAQAELLIRRRTGEGAKAAGEPVQIIAF